MGADRSRASQRSSVSGVAGVAIVVEGAPAEELFGIPQVTIGTVALRFVVPDVTSIGVTSLDVTAIGGELTSELVLGTLGAAGKR